MAPCNDKAVQSLLVSQARRARMSFYLFLIGKLTSRIYAIKTDNILFVIIVEAKEALLLH